MILSVRDIHFAYNSHPVLSGVTFDLLPGGILALLGTNGAGKSTLLKCLNKILQPRVGTILLDQQQLRTMKRDAIARRRRTKRKKTHCGSPLYIGASRNR